MPRRTVLALAGLLVLGSASPALAQEMTFEPMDIAEDAPPPAQEQALPRTVVLVIPSGAAEKALAARLTQALSRKVLESGKVEVMPSEDFQVRLFAPGEAAAQDCATNAVCISGYGKELWLDRVIMGVLYKGQSGYNLNVDLIGVERAEVEEYANRDLPSLASMSPNQIEAAMGGVVFKLFGLQDPSLGGDGPRKRLVAKAGPVQTALAWSAGGLAAVSLATGLVLGLQARSLQSELETDDALTQREGQDKIDQGESKALGAYLALTGAGVLLATSATLFLIKPLQEEEIEAAPPTPGFNLGASVTPFLAPGAAGADAGFTAGLRF